MKSPVVRLAILLPPTFSASRRGTSRPSASPLWGEGADGSSLPTTPPLPTYLIAFAVLWETIGLRPDERLFVLSGVIAGIFVAAYWLLLWFRSIRWTRERVLLTVGASVIAIGSGSFGAWAG